MDYDTEQEETQEDDVTATTNANEAATEPANMSNKPKVQGEKIQTKRNQILGIIEDEKTT